MARRRATVKELAVEASIDIDEALIAFWDAGLNYIRGPGDVVRRADVNRARRLLGSASRRELGSPGYWQQLLGIGQEEFELLLRELGQPDSLSGGRLSKKAIHRLAGEARQRGSSAYSVAPDTPVVAPKETREPFVWEVIGHERKLEYLSLDQVVAIHFALVADFREYNDPIEPAGVRSIALLDSAVNRPRTSIGDAAKYPTVEMAAAALLHSLVHDHPFHNGNKRTGLVAMLVFLDENGFLLTCVEDDLFRLVLQLAQHAIVTGPREELPDRETLRIADWLRANARWIEMGDRSQSWRRLHRLLTRYGCQFDFPSGGGRVNISRVLDDHPGLFGRHRQRSLKTQLHYIDDNRDLDRRALNKIRHDLELDDQHGVDSRAFYDSVPASPSEFIVKYRKTMRRLASL